MMNIELYKVPVTSTDFIQDAALWGRDEIRYVFRKEDRLFEGGIRFKYVTAQCTLAERCCTVWQTQAYDTLVEIENSEWVKRILEDTPVHKRFCEFHHYMIYLDSVGCFEFIADSWQAFENPMTGSPVE